MTRLFRFAPWLAVLALAFQASAQTTDYKSLHNMLIQFYGYQRAGDKTIDNKNPFYKTSPFPHANDNIGGKDLSSGWYDAGDFVKFGLPFSFSVYCLLKGYDVFPRGYDDVTSWDYKGVPDNIPDILGEAKIATDYIMRAVVSSSQIVVDVGNADEDHKELSEDGYRNSSRVSNRTVYSAGGADVAGLYAASLALMAQVYKKHDAAYAASCLAKAKEAFTFAVANQKLSTQQKNGEFYKTDTFNDKLACGAVELYRATGEETYLTQAKAFQAKVGQHFYVLGYADAGDISAFELKRLGIAADGPWLSDVAFTMSRVVKATTASPLIKGAFINSDWGNAGNAATAGFSAALAFMVSGDSKYLDFARSQAHWVAGISPFTQSYVVGYGNGPTAPHHRNDVAKLNGARLKGGVVSGPSPASGFDPAKPEASSWSFNGSDASNYKNTEVALNYNAGMVGLVAFLRDYDNPPAGQIRITTPLTVTPGNVDLNTMTAAFSAVMAPAGAWKLVLKGRTSKAKTTLSGTGTAVSATWAGVADSGSYLLGEAVDVTLDVPNIASYHMFRATTTFYITGLKKEAFKATDVVVDDFEDLDTLNKVGGAWRIFNDKPTGTSTTSPALIAGTLFATVGEADSKGLSIRLVGGAGAARPFVGISTTFNAAGTAVSLGASAASVVFDIKSVAGAVLMVELEQSNVTDGAYPAYKLEFLNTSWNRFRIPISSFAQPDWKTSTVPFTAASVKSLRFTYYGTSNVLFNLDNVRIENLAIGAAPIRPAQARGAETNFTFLNADKDGFSYRFRPAEGSPKVWTAEVMDIFGRVLAVRSLEQNPGGKAFRMPELRLGPGLYFIRHTAAGEKREYINRIRVGVGVP
jgi:endoglucanase